MMKIGPIPDDYVSLEVQQKTEFLLKIWNAIGDNSPLPASLQQHAKDEVLVNLIKLIKEVFPKPEDKPGVQKIKKPLPLPVPSLPLPALSEVDQDFIMYLEQLVRTAEAQKNASINRALEPEDDCNVSCYPGKRYDSILSHPRP